LSDNFSQTVWRFFQPARRYRAADGITALAKRGVTDGNGRAKELIPHDGGTDVHANRMK